MNNETRHTRVRRAGRILAVLASVFLGFVIILQVGLWGGAHWLNGPGGQKWLLRSLDAALKDSGYHARIEGLQVNIFGTLSAATWEISDATGPFARGTELAIEFSPVSALHKRLGLSLSAREAALLRLPTVEKKAESSPVTGFSLPDLYFTSVGIESFNVVALQLFSDDPETATVLAPSLIANATRKGDILEFKLSGGVKTPQKDSPLALLLPEKLLLSGSFDSNTLALQLDDVAAEAPAYSLAASGKIGLGTGGAIEISAAVSNYDLAAATSARVGGQANINLKLRGPTRDPAFSLTGAISDPVIQGHVLEDMTFTGNSTAIRSAGGSVGIATQYHGKKARLDAIIALQDGKLAFSDLKAAAPDLTLSAAGLIDTATGLVDGSASAKVNLAAYADLMEKPLHGTVSAEVSLKPQQGAQGLEAKITLKNGGDESLNVETGSFSATFHDIRTLWPSSGALQLTGLRRGEVAMPRLAMEFTRKEGENYAATAKGGVSSPSHVSFTATASVSGHDRASARVEGISATLTGSGGSALISGSAGPQNVDIVTTLKNLRLDVIPADIPQALRHMTASGKIALGGDMSNPVMAADLTFSPLALRRRGPTISLKTKASYGEGALRAALTGSGKGIRKLAGEVVIPSHFSLQPPAFSVPKNGTLAGSIIAEGDAGAVGALFLPRGLTVTGAVSADARLGGSLSSPDMAGNISIRDGGLTDIGNGLALRKINGSGSIGRGKIQIKSLSAQDSGAGTLSASGGFGLGGAATEISVKLRQLRPFSSNENFSGNVSGDLSLTGGAKAYTLKGQLVPRDVVINIPERFSSDVPKLNVIDPRKRHAKQAASALPPVALDLDVDASEAVFVRGWGLDAQFGGALDVGGLLEAPLVNGNLESRRGRYEEFGKRFRIEHAILRFQGTVPPSPYLDVLAETASGDITAQINLKGPVKAPVITFSSVPALPQDEVLSHILFGKSMTSISAFQAVQLARTLARLSGKGGGPDPIGLLRNVTGLDDINVQSEESGETTVGAGKYLSDKVYFEVESGTGQKSGAAKVQIEITPKVKLESKVGQDSQAGGGITFGWDY